MKLNKTYIIGCIFSLFLISSLNLVQAADTNFEGEIIFDITYEDGIDQQVLEILPKFSTLLIKSDKSFSYTKSPLGTQGVIYEKEKQNSFTIVDFLTKKLAIKKSLQDILADRQIFLVKSTKTTKETKKIMGYDCKKAVVTAYIPKLNKDISFTAFYTTDLGNNNWINQPDPIYYQIKGTLLEYEIQMGSVFMSLTAKKITPRKLQDELFKVPKTHTIVSPQEAEKILKKQ